MPYRDVRDYIAELERRGLLQIIDDAYGVIPKSFPAAEIIDPGAMK